MSSSRHRLSPGRREARRYLVALLSVMGLGILLAPVVAPALGGTSVVGSFKGTWYGHTRVLTIRSNGKVTESIGDGCCSPVIDLSLHITSASGSVSRGSAHVRITKVRVRDSSYFADNPAPRVGQRGRLRLRNGVITEPFTKTVYCNKKANLDGKCGA